MAQDIQTPPADAAKENKTKRKVTYTPVRTVSGSELREMAGDGSGVLENEWNDPGVRTFTEDGFKGVYPLQPPEKYHTDEELKEAMPTGNAAGIGAGMVFSGGAIPPSVAKELYKNETSRAGNTSERYARMKEERAWRDNEAKYAVDSAIADGFKPDGTSMRNIQEKYVVSYYYTAKGRDRYNKIKEETNRLKEYLTPYIEQETAGNPLYQKAVADYRAGKISMEQLAETQEMLRRESPSYKKAAEWSMQQNRQYAREASDYFSPYIEKEMVPFMEQGLDKSISDFRSLQGERPDEFTGVADNLLNKAEKLRDAARNGGFLTGMGDTASDWNFWSLGIADLYRAKNIRDIADKADKALREGADVEFTPEELNTLQAYAIYQQALNLYSEKVPLSYTMGQVTAEMIPFAASIALGQGLARLTTKGISAVAKKAATQEVAQAVSQALGKSKLLNSRFAQGFRQGAGFGGETTGAAGVAGNMLGGMTRGTGEALTVGAPRTWAEKNERMTGQADIDVTDSGQPLITGFSGRESSGEAFAHALAGNAIEYQSERAGQLMERLGGALKARLPKDLQLSMGSLGDYIKSITPKSLKRFYKSPYYKAFRDNIQLQGVWAEYGEEELANWERVLLGLDEPDVLLDNEQRVETLLSLLPAQLMMGAGAGVYSAGRYRQASARLDKLMKEMKASDPELYEKYGKVRGEMDGFDVKAVTGLLSSIDRDGKLNADQKTEVKRAALAEYYTKMLKSAQEAEIFGRADEEMKQAYEQAEALKERGSGNIVTADYEGRKVNITDDTGSDTVVIEYVEEDGKRVKRQVPRSAVGNAATVPVADVVNSKADEITARVKAEMQDLEHPGLPAPEPGTRLVHNGENYAVTSISPDGVVIMREDEDGNYSLPEVISTDTYYAEKQAEIDAQEQEQQPQSGERGEAAQEIASPAEEEPAPVTGGGAVQEETAPGRMPKDEHGQPLYEQADAETAWDALLEQAGGDEAMAQEVANDIVSEQEKALKAAERELKKVQDGKPQQRKGDAPLTVEARIAAKQAVREQTSRAQAGVDEARKRLEAWRKIAETPQRRRRAIEAERRQEEEEAARLRGIQEEQERAEREEAERIRREALNGVPDFIEDRPQDARARGYRRVNGNRVDRQQPIQARRGGEVQVKFDDNNIPTGHAALIEASQLQPSHTDGRRNPRHFIDEAQPKERNDEASVMSSRKIAANIRPEEITSSVTAYTGAPTVNSRGEVIQGNNRSAALLEMWAEHPEQAAKYRQYLADHAADFGLLPEDVEAMQQPVLVNMLDVTDDEAITLGQFVAQDTESGGTERIKPKNMVRKMGDDMRGFANRLLASADEEMSFAELVDRNGVDVLKWMQQKGYITPTQYKSAFDSKGNLTAEAKNDLKGVMYQSIFQNGSSHLEEMFNALPAKAQKAILATAYRDYDSPNTERMIEEIQNSISAYHALSQDPAFAGAGNYKEARIAAEAWKRQYAFDDATGESYLPSERYSNFALLLATMYKGQTQKFIQNTLGHIYDLVQGTQEADLFNQPDNTPRTLVQAINETLGNLREELLLNENFTYNGQRRSNVLAGGSASGQRGRQGSDGNAPSGGRAENGARTDDGSGRTGISDNERGRQGNFTDIAGRQQDSLEASEGEVRLSDEIDENGRQFVLTSNGQLSFGEITEESGLTPAPILLSEGIITNPATNDGYGLVHIEARHGDQIRKAGYKSVIEFIEDVAQNYERVKEGNIRNGNPTYLIQLKDKHNNTLIVELSSDGNYWNINTAGIFKESYGKNRREIYNRHTTVQQSAETVGASQEAEQSGTTTSSSMNAPTSNIVSETPVKTEPQQPNNAVSTGSSLSENEVGGITSSEPNGKPTVSGNKDSKTSGKRQEADRKERGRKQIEKAMGMLREGLASGDFGTVRRALGMYWTNQYHGAEITEEEAAFVDGVLDNYRQQGIEIINPLGTRYDEGMKVVADFRTDDTLKPGENRIVGVREPQVNTDGVMSHSASITVAISPVAEESGAEILNNKENSASLQGNQTIEYDGTVSEPIPQGEHRTETPQDSRMEEAANRLRQRSRTHESLDGRSGEALPLQEKLNAEAREAESYAKETGQWIPMSRVFDLGVPGPSGNEADTYVGNDGYIYKVNNLMNSRGILPLLERYQLHNQIFPESKYELVGFTGFDGGSIYPVFRQQYVPGASLSTPEEIDAYMQSLGFHQTGEAEYSNGDVTISDLRPRNVLRDADSDMYVIDAEFRRNERKTFAETSQERQKNDSNLSEAFKQQMNIRIGQLSKFIKTKDGKLKKKYESLRKTPFFAIFDSGNIYEGPVAIAKTPREALNVAFNYDIGDFEVLYVDFRTKSLDMDLLSIYDVSGFRGDVYDENGAYKDEAKNLLVERISRLGKGNSTEVQGVEDFQQRESGADALQGNADENIRRAESEVERNPTEAQKEAGNYRKGHVRVDGLDVTIENPKGSVRSGTDADGKRWENVMNNTYGYMRGTEGVDGDHIDVFLSDNPESGNVYVVDQRDPKTGEFDEHKVMYGFGSMEEARDAYLKNYTPGWQGLGTITEVSKDEFRKWIGSSKRKTKPFAEYKSVKKEAGQNEDVRQSRDGSNPLSAEEAAIRDAIVERLRESGIEVITDAEAGQRVLDEANGKDVRLNDRKKKANDTGLPEQDALSKAAVISFADSANILNNLEKIAKTYQDSDRTHTNTILSELGRAIKAEHKGSNSQYATIEAKNGDIVTIRLSDHNASVDKMDNAGKSNAISIVISRKVNEGIKGTGEAHIVEYFYPDKSLRDAGGKAIADIARSLQQTFYSGEYKDTTGLAQVHEVNGDTIREHRVYHGSGADFEAFDHSHMGEGEGAQAYGWGSYVTEVEGIGRTYAEASTRDKRENATVYKRRQIRDNETSINVIQGMIAEYPERQREREKRLSELEKELAEQNSQKDRIEKESGKDSVAYRNFMFYAEDIIKDAERNIARIKNDIRNESEYNEQRKRQVEALVAENARLQSEIDAIEARYPRHLYTVEIPDDTGENYLEWEKDYGWNDIDRFARRSGGEVDSGDLGVGLEDDGNAAASGASIVKSLEETFGEKEASEMLSKCGFTGISYPAQATTGGRKDGARNYVIFDEKDLQITDHVRFFRTPDGEAYGFTAGGKIYIDPRVATADTPIHEYAHLWAGALRQANPKEWNNIVDLMRDTPAWDEVKRLYPELESDEEIADEALAMYSGRRGAERLREAARRAWDGSADLGAKAAAARAMGRVRDALKRFWKGVADFLHIHYTSAEEVADKVMSDLLEGVNPNSRAELSAEERAIEEQAKKDGTWMKAPNGKPTNLTERQWVQVRTRAFKRWFGDWEKAARIEKLRKSQPIIVSGNDYQGKYELNSKSAEDYIVKSLRGEYVNKDTGNTVNITRASRKVAHHDAKHDVHLKSIAYIPQMIENAIFIDEVHNEKGTKFDSYRYYVVGLKMDGVDYTAKLVVGRKNGESYYDHALTEIEKNSLLNLTDGVKADVSDKEAAVSAVKDKRLLSLLQTNSSKVVDENGEPLVVYHGSDYRPLNGNGILIPNNGAMGKAVYFSSAFPEAADYAREKLGDMSLSEDEVYDNGYITEVFVNVRDEEDIAPSSYGNGEIIVAVRESNRIKSATDNTGDFSAVNDDIRYSRAEEEDANRRFNEELSGLTEENADKVVLSLGRPSAILRAAGVEDKPMKLYGNKVIKKMKKHGFRLDELQNLPEAVAEPIAVFNNYQKDSNRSILTELRTSNGNFLVTVDLGKDADVDFNIVTSVFGKGDNNIIGWINKGYATYIDKEKAQEFLSHQSAPIAATAANSELDTATNIVKDFENPALEDENLFRIGETKRIGGDSLFGRRITFTRANPTVTLNAMKRWVLKNADLKEYDVARTGSRYLSFTHNGVDYKIRSANHTKAYDGNRPENSGLSVSVEDRIYEVEIDLAENEMVKEDILRIIEDTDRLNDTGLNLQNAVESGVLPDEMISADRELTDAVIREVRERAEWRLDSARTNAEREYEREHPLEDYKADNGIMILNRYFYGNVNSEVRFPDGWRGKTKQPRADAIQEYEDSDAHRRNMEQASGMNVYVDGRTKAKVETLRKIDGLAGRLEQERKAGAVREMAERLHLDDVEIVTDAGALTGRRARAKGFYSPRTGRITIVIPNHASEADAVQTLLHEAVAHKGLRQLFGEHFDTFLWNVYRNADRDVRERINALASEKGWDFPTATEEYLASLAENTDFENAQRSGWWEKIKRLFIDMLRKIGLDGFSGVTLSDNELRYILWRSYENLREPGAERSITGVAADVVKQAELKVGNYAEEATGGDMAAEENDDDLMYRFIGERGASRLDAEEEATTRLDNLDLARRMEQAYNDRRARIEKLRGAKPVKIKGNEIEPSEDLKQYKKNALEYGKKLRGEYTNKDTNETISLTAGNSRGGIREILQHDYKDVEHLQSIAAIPQIIENSIFIDELPNEDNKKYPGVKSFSYYVCGLKINGVDYTVKAVIANQSNGERYYDHKLTNIEKGELLSIVPTIQKAGIDSKTPLSAVKDKRLLSLLQTDEKENARKIKSATGWERGADGKWRYETPDIKYTPVKNIEEGKFYQLSDFVNDKDLFNAYPELKFVKVVFRYEPDGRYGGYWDIGENLIDINTAHSTSNHYKNTLVHEIQHAIQDIEGFAPGGDRSLAYEYYIKDGEYLGNFNKNELNELYEFRRMAERLVDEGKYKRIGNAINHVLKTAKDNGYYLKWVVDDYDKTPYYVLQEYTSAELKKARDLDDEKFYMSISGEVEARNAEKRMGMSENKRRNTLAEETEDVAREDQIFLEKTLGDTKRGKSLSIFEDRNGAGEDGTRDTPLSSPTVHAWDRLAQSLKFQLRETAVDYLTAIDKFQDLIAKHSGRKIESFENAYDWMTFLSSRNRVEMDMFDSSVVRPLNNAILKLTGEKRRRGKWKWDEGALRELVMYVEAKHGTDRNRQMAVERYVEELPEQDREKVMTDWTSEKKRINSQNISWIEKQRQLDAAAARIGADIEQDYSGLSSIFGDTEQYPGGWRKASLSYAADYEAVHENADIASLWNAIDAATGFALRKQYETGLVSREYVDRQRDRFEHYIPLRGFSDETAGDVYSYIGHDFYPGGNPVKTAHGRMSEAGNPFGSMLNIAYSSISAGNKNMAKTALYALVRNHDTDGLAVVNRAWMVRYDKLKEMPELSDVVTMPTFEAGEETPEWVEAVPRIPEAATSDDITRIMSKFEDVMTEYRKNDFTKPIRKNNKTAYRTLNKERSEHDIPLFIAGEKYVITVTGNPRPAQAMNGLLNPDVNEDALSELGKRLQRFMAGAFTGKNAAFSIANLFRDTIYANNQMFIRENPAYWLKFTRNQRLGFGDFIPMMRRLKKFREGTLGNSKDDRLFEEFMLNGGATGYTFVNTQEEYARELAGKLDELSRKTPEWFSPKGLIKLFFDAVQFAGESAELVNRFAAYKTSREMGRTMGRSIRDAKEITVNFNRKGAGRKSADKNKSWYSPVNMASAVSQYGRCSILFWNANMQGKYRFYKNMTEHPVKTSVTLIANNMALAAVVLPLLNNVALPMLYELMGLGDDGDDENYFNVLTDWERTHNICIRLPKSNWLKIPISPDFVSWFSMGDAIGGQVSGEREMSAKDFITAVIDAVSPLSMNWSYEGSQMLLNFAPTVTQPLLQNAMNVNFMGNPLKKTPYNSKQGFKPEYQMVYSSASPTLVELSRLSNRILGGTDLKTSGWADWNPAELQNLISGYTGGYGTTFLSAADWFVGTAKGEKQAVTFSRMPLVSRFAISGNKDVKLSRVNSRFYDVKNFVDEFEYDLKSYEDAIELAQKEKDAFKTAEYVAKREELIKSERAGRYQLLKGYVKAAKDCEDYLEELPEDEVTRNFLYNLKQEAINLLYGEYKKKE